MGAFHCLPFVILPPKGRAIEECAMKVCQMKYILSLQSSDMSPLGDVRRTQRTGVVLGKDILFNHTPISLPSGESDYVDTPLRSHGESCCISPRHLHLYRRGAQLDGRKGRQRRKHFTHSSFRKTNNFSFPSSSDSWSDKMFYAREEAEEGIKYGKTDKEEDKRRGKQMNKNQTSLTTTWIHNEPSEEEWSRLVLWMWMLGRGDITVTLW